MDDLQTLEAQQAVNLRFSVSPKVIKPCVAYILAHNPENKIFNPDDYGYLIATELRRIGEEKEKATIVLKAWNSGNSHILKQNELNGLIERAYAKDYTFGCNNPMVVEYCPGKESCTYYKNLFIRRRRHNERDFYKYGWQRVLKNYEICLYHGLREIEKIQRLRPGELIIASYRFISKTSGVHIGLIAKGLNRLEELGLVRWKKGKPYRWRKTASEIRRIVAIPRPKTMPKCTHYHIIKYRIDQS